MFSKILIANRGEIACRIARTAKKMGIQTVAVYSDADRSALHVSACDEAIHIGESPPGKSYLCADKILNAAKLTGAQAIHPGFGFLSENAAFAETCTDNKITFIGPGPDVIRSMGSKSAARQLMQKAGVPVLPGYDEDDQNEALLLKQAIKIGFPLLIKAVAGGGGKGLRAVDHKDEFSAALQAVKRESMGAFGDDAVLLERYLPVARHIEIQIFADTQGNVVHLFERDCSLQRRHQKVIEEAPASGIDNDLREQIAQAAVDCAIAVGYVGAGTVEFLLAPDNTFYFMEMNTRLQVEHPVTEMITGQDLVQWQFEVAAGAPLPLPQAALQINGHAVEARIYAENPVRDFLPSIGTLTYLKPPQASASVRFDTGVTEGDEISAFYDPMIAKLICWGPTREQALTRLHSALADYHLIGPKSNILFLGDLCSNPVVMAGGADTRFIEHHLDDLIDFDATPSNEAVIAAAVYIAQSSSKQINAAQLATADPWSPWAASEGWRVGEKAHTTVQLQSGEHEFEVTLSPSQEKFKVEISGKTFEVHQHVCELPRLNLSIDDSLVRAVVIESDHRLSVLINNKQDSFTRIQQDEKPQSEDQVKGGLSSPMPGKIIACHVKVDQEVSKGQTLMVVEAMKMEHSIVAAHDAVISALNFREGDQVEEGDVLLSFKQ